MLHCFENCNIYLKLTCITSKNYTKVWADLGSFWLRSFRLMLGHLSPFELNYGHLGSFEFLHCCSKSYFICRVPTKILQNNSRIFPGQNGKIPRQKKQQQQKSSLKLQDQHKSSQQIQLVHSYLTPCSNNDGSCDITKLCTCRNSRINSYVTL